MKLFHSRFSKSHEKQADQKRSRKPSRAISTDRTETQHLANQARSLGDGTICEAQEIESLGYREDDEWVCSDTKCPARMIPCAWKGDKEYKRAPYFRTHPKDDHVEGCTGSHGKERHNEDRMLDEWSQPAVCLLELCSDEIGVDVGISQHFESIRILCFEIGGDYIGHEPDRIVLVAEGFFLLVLRPRVLEGKGNQKIGLICRGS
jgi:hypothetical protein